MTLVGSAPNEVDVSRAVDVFADRHDRQRTPTTGWYRSRIPTGLPGVGQQFAFEVDLDACTGCKACVVACHSLNGLDEEELWRSVGLLQTPANQEPDQRSVTTACHHCVDPACLNGCPVNAYEKDLITGAVIHLDDQCIGCSYCTMTCPYEVPVFNERLSIVRKCDMCHGRLMAGEEPACVQGCPNAAIRITVVDKSETLKQARASGTQRLVPDAPASALSVPATQYVSKLDLSNGPIRAASVDQTSPAPGHAPLVAMLLLVQVAVGLSLIAVVRPLGLWPALLGLCGAGASAAHLGRPMQAWRVVLGAGHSWLSREAVAIGGFVGLSGLAAFWSAPQLRVSAALAGVIAVLTSIKVYAVTHRQMWNHGRTLLRFTSVPVGTALLSAAWFGDTRWANVSAALAGTMFGGLSYTSWSRPRRYRASGSSALQRSASLLVGPLRTPHGVTVVAPLVAGIALTAFVASSNEVLLVLAGVAFVAVAWAERSLFFRSVSPDRMPT